MCFSYKVYRDCTAELFVYLNIIEHCIGQNLPVWNNLYKPLELPLLKDVNYSINFKGTFLREKMVFYHMRCCLKGQCHEIFNHFILKFNLGPIWIDKNGFANFSAFEDIREKRVSALTTRTSFQCSQQLCWHIANYFNLEKVKKN